MSKVLANTFRLKPEIRLAQAVSQFEACLSDEQKRNFRAHQSQLLNISPTHGDVMRLTAEIDRRMSRDTKSRCVGPRFTSFLEGVQQFAALGDVVVGGSQNIVACGVWSLVRMSLLSIINISSYVEKLSVLFMDIGRSAPRYQTMAILYPQSKQLQSQLLEYFTIVVNLCCHLLKFSQKSTFLQLTHSLTDSDLKIFKTELTRWSDSIKEEMILAEAVENSQFKSLSTKFSNAASHHQKIITNLRVLDFCSKYDHETAWKQIRKIGNSTLYADLAEYINWKDSSKSSTFLCAGKLGSGKSVLLANIVDDLNIHASSDKTTVAYFFCKYDVPESLRARTILGSIARQLLRTMPDLTMVAQDCMESHATNDTEKVLDILLRGFPFANRLYFVIDGLDECSALERETFVGILGKLQKRATLMLCLSFRVEPNKNLGLVFKSLAVPHICPIPEDNPDIQTFIEVELERCLQSRNLVIGDPTIILDIQDALSKGSQGMFLWVALQIQSLCEMRTDQAIKDALLDLPNDLPGTFARILLKSGKSGRTYQSKILRLVVAARRPLTTGELGEALSVIPGDATWTSSNLVNDVHLALGYCGCVITVDEEESTVHFVHHSVKQFILGEFHNSDGITFRTEQAERTMADIIVTYLSYGVFGTEVTEMRILPVSVQSAPATVMRSTLGSSGIVQDLALNLLRARKQPDFDISKTLAGARRPFQSRSLHHFCFFAYAEAYWLDHILYVSGHMPNIYNLSLKLIQQRANDGILNAKDDWECLQWALNNENEPIVKILLDSGKFGNRAGDYRQVLLWWAAEEGYKDVVKLMLETEVTDVNAKDRCGETPLLLAIKKGHASVVEQLLNVQILDIESKDRDGSTALSLAAKHEKLSIFKLLLNTKRVNVNPTDDVGRTPLLWAAYNGHDTIVKLLLETNRANMNFQCPGGQTPLSWAVICGNETVVKMLLETNQVYINSKDFDGRTSLSFAAQFGHELIVEMLLNTILVEIDSKDKDGRTPLSYAVQNGRILIVDFLLDTNQVDINSKDKNGKTPLSWATEYGNQSIINLFKTSGPKKDLRWLYKKPLAVRLSNGLISENSDPLRRFLPLDVIKTEITEENIRHELPSMYQSQRSRQLPQRILECAQKIFAILTLLGHPEDIKELLEEGLKDEHLPLYRLSHSVDILLSSTYDTSFQSFSDWKSGPKVTKFLKKQWTVLAPVIGSRMNCVELDPLCPLPILHMSKIRVESSSTVYKCEIHQAHYKSPQTHTGTISATLKLFRAQDSSDQAIYDLDEVQNVDHYHLTHFLALYIRNGRYYTISPWHDEGTLQDLWKHESKENTRNPGYALESLRQMVMLAGAIEALHRKNIPHGELHPENIFYSSEWDPENVFHSSVRGPVVGPVPVAKEYLRSTWQRPGSNKDAIGLSESTSDSLGYDIWSLGCVYLEYVIWLLYDFETLTSLHDWRDRSSNSNLPGFHNYLASNIFECYTYAIELLREDERCTEGTAFRALLDLIANHLLQVQAEKRITASEVVQRLENIAENAKANMLRSFLKIDATSYIRFDGKGRASASMQLLNSVTRDANISNIRGGLFHGYLGPGLDLKRT